MEISSELKSEPGYRRKTVSFWVIWLVLLIFSVLLFTATANRGIQWQDSGHQTLRVITREVSHPLGLALAHPLHHWLGRFAVSINLFEPCFAVTLVSVLCAAITVANLFGCVVSLTRQHWAGLITALTLAIAHTFWRMATLTESYTLITALLSAEWWCVIVYARTKRPEFLLWMMLWNGLGIANHMQALLTTPILLYILYDAYRHQQIKLKYPILALIFWVAGTLPFSSLFIFEFIQSGDLLYVVRSSLFGNHFSDAVLNVIPNIRLLFFSGCFVILNFPNLMLPIAVVGFLRIRSSDIPKMIRYGLVSAVTIHALFVFRYDVIDQHTFLLPTYFFLTLYCGIGLSHIFRHKAPRPKRIWITSYLLLLTITPLIYVATPIIAKKLGVLQSIARHKPYRDDYEYLFTPWSVVEHSAERMSNQAVGLAGNGSMIILEDAMGEFAIRYKALRKNITDITIVPEASPEKYRDTLARGGRIVLVPVNVDNLKTEPPFGKWKRWGDLYTLDVEGVDFTNE